MSGETERDGTARRAWAALSPARILTPERRCVKAHEDRSSTLGRMPRDVLGRPLRDLRISVTDRCNFRCVYCMPSEVYGRDYRFLERRELLTFEEIERVARVFAAEGVTKLRLTGGEPLVRRDVERLVERLALIPDVEVTMTTNGSLLAQKAQPLADAGLSRVTVSLDSLDDASFRALNDVDFPVARVLDGIEAAAAAGLPVKVNMVVKRGANEHDVVPMARYFRDAGHTLRFIEYMDVGNTNGWRLDDVVPSAEIVRAIAEELPLEPAEENYRGEVARRWRYRDGSGEIGVISSVTEPFCGNCTRPQVVRGGASDDELAESLRGIWRKRTDRYSEKRSERTRDLPKVEMSYIGG